MRTATILRDITAYCPRCHEQDPEALLQTVRRLDGRLIADEHVWLERTCPVHGRIVTLYDEDPEILAYLERWTAPTKPATPDDPRNDAPLPFGYRRGLGARQIQHTCVLLEDVTNACNLRCPTCFAASSPDETAMASLVDVLANVDRRLELEGGRLDVVMISGGEPTIYSDLLPLLDELQGRDIGRILLNTNGILVARDDTLLSYLASHSDRIELYLQFDGFRPSTWRHHRGADLGRIKERAIERVSDAGIFTTLVMTAALDVNDDEIGDVVLYALATPFIGGVAIQPVFGSGRGTGIDPLRRLTHTGVLRRLGPQTGGVVNWDDLIGLPCSHPHCASVGYMLRTDDGGWRSLVSLIGHEQLAAHLDLVSNRIIDPSITRDLKILVRESLHGMFSNRTSLSDEGFQELFSNINNVCDLKIGALVHRAATLSRNQHALREALASKVKRIQVKPFMDMHTMIEERLIQCCVHVGTREGQVRDQCVPFCAVQAWPALARMKVGAADAIANVHFSRGRPRGRELAPTGEPAAIRVEGF
jgi:uncharacterized radical SAM superfamily Fe-S cluster-containing enzyme